ncbi:MAG: hypothetical protein WBE18_05065 [Gammaproteobacteria bacterium]
MPIDSIILQRLRDNDTTLTELDIREKNLENGDIRQLAEALKNNTTLTTLNLSLNEIDAEGAIAIAESLKINSTLTTLNLGANKIGAEGAIAIAESLKINSTLTSFFMYENQIGNPGAIAIAETLKTNTTLTCFDSVGKLFDDDDNGEQAYIGIMVALEYNKNILREPDPSKKAKLIGQKKGVYTAPRLKELTLYKIHQDLELPKENQKIGIGKLIQLPNDMHELFISPLLFAKNYLLTLKAEAEKINSNNKSIFFYNYNETDNIKELRGVLKKLTEKSNYEVVLDCFNKAFDIIKTKYETHSGNEEPSTSHIDKPKPNKIRTIYDEMKMISETLPTPKAEKPQVVSMPVLRS